VRPGSRPAGIRTARVDDCSSLGYPRGAMGNSPGNMRYTWGTMGHSSTPHRSSRRRSMWHTVGCARPLQLRSSAAVKARKGMPARGALGTPPTAGVLIGVRTTCSTSCVRALVSRTSLRHGQPHEAEVGPIVRTTMSKTPLAYRRVRMLRVLRDSDCGCSRPDHPSADECAGRCSPVAAANSRAGSLRRPSIGCGLRGHGGSAQPRMTSR
jgi:hypothetical protein